MAYNQRTPLANVIPGGWNKNLIKKYNVSSKKGAQGKAYHELCIVCSHTADMQRANGGCNSVTRNLFYRIRGYRTNNNPARYLAIEPLAAPCGYMSAEQYEQALRVGSPDGPGRGIAHAGTPVDFTALCYVVGFVCARTILDLDVELPAHGDVEVLSFYAHFDAHTHSEPVITKALYANPNELQTLLSLFRLCGVTRVFTTAKTVCERGRLLTGRSLGHYTLGVFCSIIGATEQLGCAAPHFIAWFRGAMAAVTICAHTEEGGWLRKVLKMADYPKPLGIVPDLSPCAYSYPKRANPINVDVCSHFLEFYLLCIRCITAADPADPQFETGTVVKRDEGAVGNRADCFTGLQELFSMWCDKFLSEVAVAAGLSRPDLSIERTFSRYWRGPPVDSHLNHEVIIPFFLVEPAGLDVFDNIKDPFPRIGSFTREERMPPLGRRCIAIIPMKDYGHSAAGTAFRQCGVRFVTEGFTLRGLGLAYVWSGDGVNNNLLHVRPVVDPDHDYYHKDLALARGDGLHSLSESRWIIPHAPVPHPAECWGGSRRRMFHIIYTGRPNQGCLDDLKNQMVRMRCSTLHYAAATEAKLPVCARTLPGRFAREVELLNKCIDAVQELGAAYAGEVPPGGGGARTTTPIWKRALTIAVVPDPPADNVDDVAVGPAVVAPEGGLVDEISTLTLATVPPAPLGDVVHTHTAANLAVNLQARNLPAAGAANIAVPTPVPAAGLTAGQIAPPQAVPHMSPAPAPAHHLGDGASPPAIPIVAVPPPGGAHP